MTIPPFNRSDPNSSWIVFTNFILLVYTVAYALFAANIMNIRLADPVGGRWNSWVFWRFWISALAAPFPAYTMHIAVLYRSPGWRFTLNAVIDVVVGAWFGVLVTTFIIDWTNCMNVTYCVNPSDSDKVDLSFYWAFITACIILVGIVLFFALNRYLLYRVQGRLYTEFYSNQNRPATDLVTILSSIDNNNGISAPIEEREQYYNADEYYHSGSNKKYDDGPERVVVRPTRTTIVHEYSDQQGGGAVHQRQQQQQQWLLDKVDDFTI